MFIIGKAMILCSTFTSHVTYSRSLLLVWLLAVVFTPLQGFWNAFIFARPVYYRIKKKNPDIGFFQAAKMIFFDPDPVKTAARSATRSAGTGLGSSFGVGNSTVRSPKASVVTNSAVGTGSQATGSQVVASSTVEVEKGAANSDDMDHLGDSFDDLNATDE